MFGNQGGDAVALQSSANLDLQVCPACNHNHEQVACKPYIKQFPPFTHYFICPETGEPVSLSITWAQADNTIRVVHNKIMREVAYSQGKPLLAAIMCSEPDGKLYCEMTRIDIPPDRFDKVRECFEDCLKKMEPNVSPGPLKRAVLGGILGKLPHLPPDAEIPGVNRSTEPAIEMRSRPAPETAVAVDAEGMEFDEIESGD